MSEMMHELRCLYDPGLCGLDELCLCLYIAVCISELCCPGKVSRAIGLQIHAELSRARSLSPKAPSFGFRCGFDRDQQGQFWTGEV